MKVYDPIKNEKYQNRPLAVKNQINDDIDAF